MSPNIICGKQKEEFLSVIKNFHGFTAPGLVIGGFMVDLAVSLTGADVEADAIVETKHCLPDAIQLFTSCTIGNGWLKILDWDKFALTLYDRRALKGYRVWFDPEKAKMFPELYNWYMRLASKKELPLALLLDIIFKAGDSVLSFRPVDITDFYIRDKKDETAVCPNCHEAYPTRQGATCMACQGRAYYQYHQ